MLFKCVAKFVLIKATGVNAFTSAQIARWLFLLCAGIILPLISFGSTTLCFASLLQAIVLLCIVYLNTWIFKSMKLLTNFLEKVLLSSLLVLNQPLGYRVYVLGILPLIILGKSSI